MTLMQVTYVNGKVSRVFEGPDTEIEIESSTDSKGVTATYITITEYPTPLYLRG